MAVPNTTKRGAPVSASDRGTSAACAEGGNRELHPTDVGRAGPSSFDPGVASAFHEPGQTDIRRLLGLSVPVAVVLAARELPIESILGLTAGSIIEFEARFDSDLMLQVANRVIGKGQAVKVGENFGLRVTQIDTVPDRIDALGMP